MAIDYSWSFRVYKQVDPCRLNFRPSKNTPLVAQVLSPASSFVTFSMYSITLYNCRTALDGGETTPRFVNSAADPLWISKIFYLLKSSTVKLWSKSRSLKIYSRKFEKKVSQKCCSPLWDLDVSTFRCAAGRCREWSNKPGLSVWLEVAQALPTGSPKYSRAGEKHCCTGYTCRTSESLRICWQRKRCQLFCKDLVAWWANQGGKM